MEKSAPIFDAVVQYVRQHQQQPYYGDDCEAYLKVTLQSCGSYVPNEFMFRAGNPCEFPPSEIYRAVCSHFRKWPTNTHIAENIEDRWDDIRLLCLCCEKRSQNTSVV